MWRWGRHGGHLSKHSVVELGGGAQGDLGEGVAFDDTKEKHGHDNYAVHQLVEEEVRVLRYVPAVITVCGVSLFW